MPKERIHYIDVAKGILILMVIYCHACLAMKFVDHPFNGYIQKSNIAFAPYYMPAFFVITGFCSNFKKPFADFIMVSIKTLVLPAISFMLLYLILGCNFDWMSIKECGRSLILYGGNFWFLPCLFVGKLMYYVLSRHFTGKKLALVCTMFFIVGVAINPFPRQYEFWWFAHAVILMPYLGVGQYLRNTDLSFLNHYMLFSFAYVFILITTALFSHIGLIQTDDGYIPMIVKQVKGLNVTTVLPYILISLSGSFMVFAVSLKINANSVLEYLGRNSLTVYCAQALALRLVYPHIGKLISPSDSYMVCFIVFTIGFILTVGLCSSIAYIMNIKYIKVLIGKF